MFEDLIDAARMLFSGSWPTAQAAITQVEIERIHHPDRREDEVRLSVCYRFYVGDDGPYTGESFWKPNFTCGLAKRMRDAKRRMNAKRTALVRYRQDDPSQNRLDREAWRDL